MVEIGWQTRRAALQFEQRGIHAPTEVIELDRAREGARTPYRLVGDGVAGRQQQDAKQQVNNQVEDAQGTLEHGGDYN